MMRMGILGDFDIGNFQQAHNKWLAIGMFVSVIIIIAIIMLNGLIAVLGDS